MAESLPRPGGATPPTGQPGEPAAGSGVAGTPPRDHSFFGHPRALSTLFFVEMWERFSYYGMASILVLYLTDPPARGGLGLPVAQAAAAYALYVAVIYVVSLPGGWLADRVLGGKKAVLIGGAIIASGHFTMAIGGANGVFLGLAIIVVGTGLLKPNTASLVGDLYAEDDPQRSAGFSIYYMAINIGGFVAPLVTGYLAEAVGYHAGFGAAAVGMTVGLIHYALDWRGMGDIGARPRTPLTPAERRRDGTLAAAGIAAVVAVLAVLLGPLQVPLPTLTQWIGWAVVVLPIAYFVALQAQPGHTPVERHRLVALFVLFLATAIWFAVVSQAGSTLNVFAEDDTQRRMWGFVIPAAWFQSINPLAIIVLAPLYAAVWTRMGERQPTTPVKFALALVLVALSMGMMVVAARFAPLSGTAEHLVSPLWLLGVYIAQTMGELLISPIGLSVATQLAPPKSAAQTMGLWYLAFSVGAALSGQLAQLYGVVSVPQYYALLGGMLLAAAVAIAVLRPVLLHYMEGVR